MGDIQEKETGDYKVSLAEVKVEMKHVNKRLDDIDSGMKQLRRLMAQQNNLQKEISQVLIENTELKAQISGMGNRISKNAQDLEIMKKTIDDIPKNWKEKLFDYIWKYIAVAIGGWIALKISGILP
jgi:flagellar biosynthesis chaperone FliJ